MTRNLPAAGIPHLLLPVVLGLCALPVTGAASEDSQAEREARRYEFEAIRLQEQARREIEMRETAQAEALRSQEESIRRMQQTQARMEADSQRRAQDAADQLRNYSYPVYPYITPSSPVSRIPPIVAPSPGDPPPQALTLPVAEARTLPAPAPRIDAISGITFAPLSDRLKSYFGTQSGVLVVSAGGRAPFGLQDGDVIISIDGRVPADGPHAESILRSYRTGDQLKLRLQRDRRVIELNAKAP